MTLNSPEVKHKLSEWQDELRKITGNDTLLMVAFHPPTSSLKINQIVKIVCEETGVPLSKVKHRSRRREYVTTRHLIAYYGAIFSGLSLKRIGKIIGGRDHTTVIHARDRVRELLETSDIAICSAVEKINKRLGEGGQNIEA